MANLPSHPALREGETLNGIVRDYFKKGYTYVEILEFLKVGHKAKISLSTLKRALKKLNCFRRPLPGKKANFDEVKEVMREELYSTGSILGYGKLWSHLNTSGVLVRRKDVRLALLKLDPQNVDKRRRRRLRRRKYHSLGPNFVWHIDGHDKLKPYGISIHGCIDGYSRRIIWLEVAASNKVPELIAKHYLDALKQMEGKPKTVTADNANHLTFLR